MSEESKNRIAATYEGKQVTVEQVLAKIKPGDLCLNSKKEVITVSQGTCVFFDKKISRMFLENQLEIDLYWKDNA